MFFSKSHVKQCFWLTHFLSWWYWSSRLYNQFVSGIWKFFDFGKKIHNSLPQFLFWCLNICGAMCCWLCRLSRLSSYENMAFDNMLIKLEMLSIFPIKKKFHINLTLRPLSEFSLLSWHLVNKILLENAVVDIFPNQKNIHNLFTCFDFFAAGLSSPLRSCLLAWCCFLLVW